MNTDIDHLHKVISGQIYGRQCGKTYARCHQLAGHIETGHQSIICEVARYDDLSYLLPMIEQVFREHRLVFTFNKSNYLLMVEPNSVVRFLKTEDIQRKSRGLEYLYLPMAWWD